MALKVCFVCMNALGILRPGSGEIGGAELKLTTFARLLAADPRFEVTVLCRGDRAERFMVDGARVQTLVGPSPSGGRAWLFSRALRALGHIRWLWHEGADVYIQSCAGIETALTHLGACLARGRFVYWVAHQWDIDGTFEAQLGFRTGRLLARALAAADRIICQTSEQSEIVARRHRRPITIVPNVLPPVYAGTPAAEAPPGPGAPETILPLHERKGALWVGRWHPIKQPELFVELARRFPGVPFRMLVSRRPERLPEPLPPNLSMEFTVPVARTGAHFARARVYVNTSQAEGFPNTFLQALAVGTPVVSLISDPDRMLETHATGRCAGGDRERLAADVGQLLQDDRLWESCSGNGPSYVRSHHDPGRALEILKEALLELAGQEIRR